jgi:hypothetical protein
VREWFSLVCISYLVIARFEFFVGVLGGGGCDLVNSATLLLSERLIVPADIRLLRKKMRPMRTLLLLLVREENLSRN